MAKSENNSYEDLRGDGRVVIYKRDESSNYYVRLKVLEGDGNYKFRVRSLKTKDRSQAVSEAFRAHDEITFHLKSGGNLDGRTFKKVFEEWKQTKQNTYDSKAKADRTVEYAGLYSLDYFEIYDLLSDLNPGLLSVLGLAKG